MEEHKYDAIVIGAGHNGLVTAAYLAKSDLSVLVLERLDKVGGACTTDEIFPGFHGPMCAYGCHLLQGKVIDDLKLREYGFEIITPDIPGSRYPGLHPFPDGTHIAAPRGGTPIAIAEEFAKFSEHDARAFLEWDQFMREAAGIIYPSFLSEPPTLSELEESVRGTHREEVLEKLLTWSLVDFLDHYFEDEHIKAYCMVQTECDPRLPGSAVYMAYAKCSMFGRAEDRGMPRGSMGTITKSMAASATALGVEIRTGAPVERVIVEGEKAVGVRLASGEEVRSDLVVSNADPKRTYSTLVQREDIGEAMAKRAEQWKTDTGSLKFLAALKEPPDFSRYLGDSYDRDRLAYFHICPSVEYHLQSWDDAANGRPSSSPVMSIQMPSLIDPALAPRSGGIVLSNWVLYEPRHLKEGTWDDVRDDVGNHIIDIITEYAPNFRSSLIDWTLQTPLDIEERVGITDGQIRHGNWIPEQMLAGRFPYRTPVQNLYMCGAGTHPGGEVSGAPGHNCAHAILKDLGRV